VRLRRPRAERERGRSRAEEEIAQAAPHGLQTPVLWSHVRPDGQLPPFRQSGTHIPAHGSPDGQHTSPEEHEDAVHDPPPMPASGPPMPPPSLPPVAVPFTQRWMKGYVSVM